MSPRRRRSGGTAIETAAVLPLLLLLLLAAADYAYLGLVQQQLAHAARTAARYGITGQPPEAAPVAERAIAWCDGRTPPAVNPRIARIREIVAGAATGVLRANQLCLELLSYNGYHSIGRPEPFVDTNGDRSWSTNEAFTDTNGNGVWDRDQGASSAGGGGEIAVYTLRYATRPLTGLTPGLPKSQALRFTARIPVRNEPF